MKKLFVLFVAALVAAPAFAQVSAEKIQKNMERKLTKGEFAEISKSEQSVQSMIDAFAERDRFNEVAKQSNNYFIAQYILINLADPLVKLGDMEALPKAVVYNTFRVGNRSMVDFVRAFAGQFQPKEEGELRAFAGRVEALNEWAKLTKMHDAKKPYFTAEYILINIVDPFANLSDKDAASKAAFYKDHMKVGNTPLLTFVADYTEQRGFESFDAFISRVEKLAK